MKSKVESSEGIHAQGEAAQANQDARFFYEVSRRPKYRHKKVFAARGVSVITPSGARVPPAWTDVWITTDPRSPIQATGSDTKGRRVYLYSAEHIGRSAAAKFSRLKAFGRAYPSLIKKVRRDMKTSEEAIVLHLISKTGFRIGSNSETLAKVKAFGASTLRCSHVNVDGNKLTFDFTGKRGIRINKVLKDAFLARNVAGRCDSGADQKIFRTTDDEIRAYLNSIPQGSSFSVKDFRTYIGTLTAFRKIKTMPVPSNHREFKSYRKEVGETVARKLGNSPTIALKSYISPEVFCAWESNYTLPKRKAGGKRSSLADEFLECIHYDQEVPMEAWWDSDLQRNRHNEE
jgi:DNA topoisomerase-1